MDELDGDAGSGAPSSSPPPAGESSHSADVIITAPTDTQAHVIIVLGLVSAVCCLAVLILSSIYPVLRQPPARFVRSRSLFGLLYSLCLFGYALWVVLPSGMPYNIELAERSDPVCRSQLGTSNLSLTDVFLTVARFWETGIVLWQLVLALDILSIVRNPFKPDRHVRKYVLFVVGASLAVAFATLGLLIKLQEDSFDPATQDFVGRCSGRSVHQHSAAITLQLTVQGFALLVVALVTVLIEFRLRSGLAISERSRHRVRRQLRRYTVGFGTLDLIVLIMKVRPTPALAHARLPRMRPPERSILCVLPGLQARRHRAGATLVVLALRGTLDAIVWIASNCGGLASAKARSQGLDENGLAVASSRVSHHQTTTHHQPTTIPEMNESSFSSAANTQQRMMIEQAKENKRASQASRWTVRRGSEAPLTSPAGRASQQSQAWPPTPTSPQDSSSRPGSSRASTRRASLGTSASRLCASAVRVVSEATQTSARAVQEATHGAEKLDIAEELRYELVLLTAHGIGQCTAEAWAQNAKRVTDALTSRREERERDGHSSRATFSRPTFSRHPSRAPERTPSSSANGSHEGSARGGGGGGVSLPPFNGDGSGATPGEVHVQIDEDGKDPKFSPGSGKRRALGGSRDTRSTTGGTIPRVTSDETGSLDLMAINGGSTLSGGLVSPRSLFSPQSSVSASSPRNGTGSSCLRTTPGNEPLRSTGSDGDLSVVNVSTTGGYRPHIEMPGHNGRTLDFFDYGTEIFAGVRAALGLDGKDLHGESTYAQAFQAVELATMREADQANKSKGFREIISSGASGSYFYFTPDKKYIVKTVSKGEKETLIRSGAAYLAHCQQHPATLISYLGCHSIRLPLNTCKVYFVVMQNVLPCKPDMCFDLKGATSNRQRVRGADRDKLLSGARAPNSFSTLLDKDWMAMGKIGARLNLKAARKAQLQRIIAADAQFLAEQMMMDYSLLVGVLMPPEGGGTPRQVGEGRMATHGDGGETYLIGVIDILERWHGLRWPVQGAILKFVFRYITCSRWYNPEGITAIHPTDYAARFKEFFDIHVLGLPPPDGVLGRREGVKTWHPYW